VAIRSQSWFSYGLWLLPICWLWFRLIDHLRVEWSVNAQYGYGWAVPFLCAYLLWQRLRAGDERSHTAAGSTRQFDGPGRGNPTVQLPTPIFHLFFALLALLYAPTRLIEEANPEWRLVSWALALEVVGITLLWASAAGVARWQVGEGMRDRPPSYFHLRNIAFAICFFLVAVPWPTVIEGPLIQALTRANASATVELMRLGGIPAVQRGNVIEIVSGVVGIDEACSGIRSFQAALMISLFLGELYRLHGLYRLALVVGGFVMSFVFNVGRTTLLVWVAAHQGVAAISSWHDPAGVAILLCCFFGLWVMTAWLRKFEAGSVKVARNDSGSTISYLRTPVPGFYAQGLPRLSVALAAWLLVVEVSVEWWYRSHEARLARSAVWRVDLPEENPSIRKLPMSEAAQRMLRYDEAVNATWEAQGKGFQVIYLRWNPGRTALHLARGHTPEVCLTAAGRKLAARSDERQFDVHGVRLPFRGYAVIDESRPLHVFYCLWDDLAGDRSFDTMTLSYGNRLAPVLAGRRNPGQRSIEIAVWGSADTEAAAAAAQKELEKLVVVK